MHSPQAGQGSGSQLKQGKCLGAVLSLYRHAVPAVQVLCCAVLCCAVLCCAALHCAVLCCAVLSCAVLCHAVLCCAVLCRAVPRCAVLCHAVLALIVDANKWLAMPVAPAVQLCKQLGLGFALNHESETGCQNLSTAQQCTNMQTQSTSVAQAYLGQMPTCLGYPVTQSMPKCRCISGQLLFGRHRHRRSPTTGQIHSAKHASTSHISGQATSIL